jgi:uncharacterized protein (DUF58 family)
MNNSGNHGLQRPDVLRPDLEYLIHLQGPAATLRLRQGYPRALMAGGHLSRFQGRGVEFDEVRPYQPGDDIRSMDWRVTARTGKPHTKLFREERERPALIMIDLRPAMFFATRGALKAVIAAECASLLAWSVVHQGDRVGSLMFDAGEQMMPSVIRPVRGKRGVMRLLGSIVGHAQWRNHQTGTGETFLSTLQRGGHAARTGSLMIIISDGRGLDETCEAQLKQLLPHHNIVFVFIYDPFEAAMQNVGSLLASDGQKTSQINSADAQTRQQHAEHFSSRRGFLQELAKLPGFFLIECSTTDDPFTKLQATFGITR